jgi:hypothetical protein
MVEIILNRSFALTLLDVCAGIMIPSPVLGRFDFSISMAYTFYFNKGRTSDKTKRYTIDGLIYIIHTFSRVSRRLFLSILKWEGVSPVIFLNWLDR